MKTKLSTEYLKTPGRAAALISFGIALMVALLLSAWATPSLQDIGKHIAKSMYPEHQRVATRLTTSSFPLFGLDYNPYIFSQEGLGVPPVIVAQMPRDLPQITHVDTLKQAFIQTMLPIALTLRDARERQLAFVLQWEDSVNLDSANVDSTDVYSATADSTVLQGAQSDPQIRKMMEALFAYYRVDVGDFDQLKRALVPIPVSLVLAQSALESGWGRSRFAMSGNAMFGEWSFDGSGMVPIERPENQTYRVRSFPDLTSSMEAYLRNLSTHRAYRKFRQAAMRNVGPQELAQHLKAYARAHSYVKQVASLIRNNQLEQLDAAQLAELSEFQRYARTQ